MCSRILLSVTVLTAMNSFGAGSALAQPAAVEHADPTITRGVRQLPEEGASAVSAKTEVKAASAVAPTGGPSVFVGAVTIAGLRKLAPSDFADIVATRIGRTLSAPELASLADAIAARMRSQGYPLAIARVEVQRLSNGILTVNADEGRIDELRFDGPDAPSVRRALEPLLHEVSVHAGELERRVLMAGDIDGVRIERSRFLRENDRGILIIQTRRDPASFRISLSNAGTKPLGPEQVRMQGWFNGLLASDDSLAMTYSTTPAQPRELHFGMVRYEKRVSRHGTELALVGSASLTRPGSYLASLNLKNRSWYAGASVLQPLHRRRKASYWIEGELGLRSLVQWRHGGTTRDDKLTTARLTLYGYQDLAGGRLRSSATLSQGLGILGSTSFGDPLASRKDADGTFTTATLWTEWTADLGDKFSIRFAGHGQLASQPLLISEEVSLGGTVFLRGYDWGERSGDQGVMGMAELRYLADKPFGALKRAQLYVFVDGGTVANLGAGSGGGSLVSAGGGVRMDVTANFGASFELAVPLTGVRYDTGNRAPKLNFSLTRSF